MFTSESMTTTTSKGETILTNFQSFSPTQIGTTPHTRKAGNVFWAAKKKKKLYSYVTRKQPPPLRLLFYCYWYTGLDGTISL